MGVYAGIENAEPMSGGVYFEPGLYIVLINACKGRRTRKGADAFIAETTILQSSNSERPPGVHCTWMQTSDKEGWLGRVRGFCAEASDAEVKEVDEPAVEAIVSSANPLEGVVIRAEAQNVKTKAGGIVTAIRWQRMDAAEQEDWRKKATGLAA